MNNGGYLADQLSFGRADRGCAVAVVAAASQQLLQLLQRGSQLLQYLRVFGSNGLFLFLVRVTSNIWMPIRGLNMI